MLPLQRFKVTDQSMTPLFNPGDFVIVNCWAYVCFAPKTGEVVVLKDPEKPGIFLLKRIGKVLKKGIFVVGDNASKSRDSRQFGLVKKSSLVGKVIWQIKKKN